MLTQHCDQRNHYDDVQRLPCFIPVAQKVLKLLDAVNNKKDSTENNYQPCHMLSWALKVRQCAAAVLEFFVEIPIKALL